MQTRPDDETVSRIIKNKPREDKTKNKEEMKMKGTIKMGEEEAKEE